jgi:uracil phosphoribosyltransferase
MSNGVSKQSEFGERVHVSDHPILAHKTTILRSSTTTPSVFRAVLRELTYHLGYEATSRLTTKPVDISVPVPSKSGDLEHMDYEGSKLKENVALIPILRSGLGMVDAMLELIPNAAIHHIGMYRVLGQNPVQYYNRLPRKCTADVAYVLDPCIATSSTIESVIKILKKVRIRFVASER